jgi:hypothetical protein
MTLLLPALALRAFLGVSPIGTARRTVSHLSVLELCPLNSPRYRASLHSPPEQQPRVHMPAASFRALLTTLLLLLVVAGLSGRHSCFGVVEKAYGELQFVSRRPLTPEIRCSRSALRRTGRQSTATLFSVHCCCWLWLQAVAAVTAGSAASRRPTGSFSLSRGDHIHPRYVALATLFQHCVDMPSSLNLWTKRSPFLANTHAAARATAQAVS